MKDKVSKEYLKATSMPLANCHNCRFNDANYCKLLRKDIFLSGSITCNLLEYSIPAKEIDTKKK